MPTCQQYQVSKSLPISSTNDSRERSVGWNKQVGFTREILFGFEDHMRCGLKCFLNIWLGPSWTYEPHGSMHLVQQGRCNLMSSSRVAMTYPHVGPDSIIVDRMLKDTSRRIDIAEAFAHPIPKIGYCHQSRLQVFIYERKHKGAAFYK